MKKTIIISSVTIFTIVVIFFVSYFMMTSPKFRGEFSVNKFEDYIQNENFQTDKNYGKIIDFKSAAKAGEMAINERFENSDGSILEWLDCAVRYDKENDAYYVRISHVTPLVKGGAYDVIIQSDGAVLAIWGEK